MGWGGGWGEGRPKGVPLLGPRRGPCQNHRVGGTPNSKHCESKGFFPGSSRSLHVCPRISDNCAIIPNRWQFLTPESWITVQLIWLFPKPMAFSCPRIPYNCAIIPHRWQFIAPKHWITMQLLWLHSKHWVARPKIIGDYALQVGTFLK